VVLLCSWADAGPAAGSSRSARHIAAVAAHVYEGRSPRSGRGRFPTGARCATRSAGGELGESGLQPACHSWSTRGRHAPRRSLDGDRHAAAWGSCFRSGSARLLSRQRAHAGATPEARVYAVAPRRRGGFGERVYGCLVNAFDLYRAKTSMIFLSGRSRVRSGAQRANAMRLRRRCDVRRTAQWWM
jgi:hypothetical protein